MSSAVQSIEIEAPREIVYQVVSDCEAYPEFLPEIEAATVLSRDDGGMEVEMCLHLIKRLTYTIRLTTTPPTGLSWTLVAGPFQTNSGSWELEAIDDRRTRATYSIEVAVSMFVPGAITKRLVGSTLPTTLAAFKARAESLAGG